MLDYSKWSISELITHVRDLEQSEENRRRQREPLPYVVEIENPITWAILFDYDVNTLFSDPSLYVRQHLLQQLWHWDHIEDDLPIVSDIPAWLGYYPEYTFLGMDVQFNRKGVPVISSDHPISREANLALLEPVDFYHSGWMPRALRWYDDVSGIVNGQANVTFLTWWRGCLDLAIQLRGYENLMLDTMEDPKFVKALLELITSERNKWHAACCKYFHIPLKLASIGDDWINIPFITPDFFCEFVLPCYKEIEKHHGGIESVHSCGNLTAVYQYLLELDGLDVLEVSPWTDLEQSINIIPPEKELIIKLSPGDVLYTAQGTMEKQLRNIAERTRGRKIQVRTSGLTIESKLDTSFLQQIQLWTDTAKRVLR